MHSAASTVAAPDRARARLVPLATVTAISVYLLLLLWLAPKIFWAPPDFACFYRAGRMALSGSGAQVYDLAAEQRFDATLAPSLLRPGQHTSSLPYVFAPFSLLVFAPISALPYSQAEALWFVVNVSSLLALPLLLRQRLRLSDHTVALALLLPPFFIPVMIAVMHGQTSPLLALLLTLVFLSLERRRDVLAGVLLALSAWKPQFVFPALVALLAARQWKAIAGFATTSVALLGAAIVQIGWRAVLVGFPKSILKFSQLPRAMFGEDVRHMPNLRGLCEALLGPGPLARSATICCSIVLLCVLAFIFRDGCRASLKLKFAILLVVTVLVSYHCYGHDATLLVPVALLLAGATVEGSLTWYRVPVWIVLAMIFLAAYASPHSAAMFGMAAFMLILVVLLTAEAAKLNSISPQKTAPGLAFSACQSRGGQ